MSKSLYLCFIKLKINSSSIVHLSILLVCVKFDLSYCILHILHLFAKVFALFSGMLMDLISPLFPSAFVFVVCLGSISRSFSKFQYCWKFKLNDWCDSKLIASCRLFPLLFPCKKYKVMGHYGICQFLIKKAVRQKYVLTFWVIQD